MYLDKSKIRAISTLYSKFDSGTGNILNSLLFVSGNLAPEEGPMSTVGHLHASYIYIYILHCFCR